MSLYNMLHGMNATLVVMASPYLPRRADKFPRFRNIFTSADDTSIKGDLYVYTRMGGGNAECWEDDEEGCTCGGCDAAGLAGHPLCVGHYDDDFDCTYRTFVFRVPDDLRGSWEALQQGDQRASLTARFRERLAERFPPGSGEKIDAFVDHLLHDDSHDSTPE